MTTVKYDRIGTDYNDTRQADPFLANKLFELLNPNKEGQYLDIGCGTGNYTIDLFCREIRMIGIDPSEQMLKIARSKNSGIIWKIGSAEATNLESSSIDGMTGFLTIHHWTDLTAAFIELKRILKANGKIVIFTSTPEQMKGYWLNHYFPNMMQKSIEQMPDLESIKNAAKQSGLRIESTEKYFIRNEQIDHFLYVGKHRPKLYLNPGVRNGISSFADLALQDEVNEGLVKLDADINSGKIDSIIRSFENDLGDYLFVNMRNELAM